MDYLKLAELIPAEKRGKTADLLVDIILSSKNDDKMPTRLANTILYQWQQNLLHSITGLSNLLQASILLEQEKTITLLRELQLSEIANRIKGEI
jgi:hypothetical protein